MMTNKYEAAGDRAMKVEIEVEISQAILDKYDVVAFRRPERGEIGLVSGIGIHFYEDSSEPYLILRPKAQWPEWPEWLTADWAVKDSDGEWVLGLGLPPAARTYGWDYTLCQATEFRRLRTFTNITPPTYDGPWQHSLIRNPHKGGE